MSRSGTLAHVFVSPAVVHAALTHALTAEREEVMGVLFGNVVHHVSRDELDELVASAGAAPSSSGGGHGATEHSASRPDPHDSTSVAFVHRSLVLPREDKRPDRVEISAMCLVHAQEAAERLNRAVLDAGGIPSGTATAVVAPPSTKDSSAGAAERGCANENEKSQSPTSPYGHHRGVAVRVLGWYHSHPHITPYPSAVDLNSQLTYQSMDTNWVGLIFSVFSNSAASSSKHGGSNHRSHHSQPTHLAPGQAHTGFPAGESGLAPMMGDASSAVTHDAAAHRASAARTQLTHHISMHCFQTRYDPNSGAREHICVPVTVFNTPLWEPVGLSGAFGGPSQIVNALHGESSEAAGRAFDVVATDGHAEEVEEEEARGVKGYLGERQRLADVPRLLTQRALASQVVALEDAAVASQVTLPAYDALVNVTIPALRGQVDIAKALLASLRATERQPAK